MCCAPLQLISNTQMSNSVLEVALCLSQQLLVEQVKDNDSSYVVGESVLVHAQARSTTGGGEVRRWLSGAEASRGPA